MDSRAPFFFALELSVYQPAVGTTTYADGRGNHPRGAATLLPSIPAASATLLASDAGYRTRATDPGGVQVYPPWMDQAFELDRHISLDPAQNAGTASYGSVRLSNLGQRYDAYVQTRNCDSRPMRLLIGQKTMDATRGIALDPPYAALTPFFGGTATSWSLSEEELEVPLTDGTYWANRPLQGSFYTGAGGLGGGSDLTGKPLPIVRGGTAAHPVLNVAMVAVDPVHLIYQYTDAPGTVVTLYEGGAAVFAYDGDVSDLYAGTAPAAGHYRTNNARGLVQMGSTPVRALTGDVTGQFAAAGVVTTAVALAAYVLLEVMAQPVAEIDVTSWMVADSTYPFTAGFAVGTDAVAGLDIVRLLLGSIGARMVTVRSGLLSVFVLRALPATASPQFRLSPANALSVTPVALPTSLDPPPYRWRVGWGKINQVQTSDFNGAITAARQSILANEYQLVAWSSSAVSTAWRRPNDPDVVETALLVQTDAQALANSLGTLFAGPARLYEVEVPFDVALPLDIGRYGTLDWPLRNLGGGRLCQIVGEAVRSYDGTAKLYCLVDSP